MTMWNDTDTPLGFLITFRTYGSWLHGDERTSVDRFNNSYGSPRIPHREGRLSYNKRIMKQPEVILDAKMRKATEDAIYEVCKHRKWLLRAINVRTNHAHTVVSTGVRNSDKVLNAFKAYATRKMRETGCWKSDRSPWGDKGSERWLWNDQSIWYACDYVINGQGDDLRDFDSWGR